MSPQEFIIGVKEATGEAEPEQEKPLSTEGKNPNAVALGRLGGLKGGKARASRLTPEQRREITLDKLR